MKLKAFKKFKQLQTIQQIKQSGVMFKAMKNNINHLEKFIPKINILSNKFKEYIEKHKKENDTELLELFEGMIEIQEIIQAINPDKIIDVKKK